MPLLRVSFAHAHPAQEGWEPGRADMGIDGTFRKFWRSMVDVVVEFAGEFQGWDGSHGIITRATESLDAHPNLKRFCPTGWFYVVEGIEPVVRNGQHVRAGEIIGHAARNPYNGIIGNVEHGVSAAGRPGAHLQVNPLAREMGEGDAARHMVFNYIWGTTRIIGMSPPTSIDHAGRA